MEKEKQKPLKMNLSTFITIITITVVIMLAIFMYIQKKNSEDKIKELQNETANLQGTIRELQGKLEGVSDSAKTKIENSEYFILYKGCEMKIATGTAWTESLDKSKENKYNTTYYNYENGKYLGESNGKVIENGIEDTFVVDNVKKIAMSKKFNAVPRNYTEINQLPEELMDMADCTTVNINSIDLDGDGTEEKIVCWTASEAKGDFENNEPVAQSGIILFDSKYKKIADLVTLDDGFAASERLEQSKVFLSLDDVEYLDIDNDGIMEIITELPQYESEGPSELSVVKYNKGNLEGKTDIKANVRP